MRALEKGAVKGFEGYDRHEMADVDAAKEMERAKIEIKEREERKAVSKNPGGELAKPKMNITVSLQVLSFFVKLIFPLILPGCQAEWKGSFKAPIGYAVE